MASSSSATSGGDRPPSGGTGSGTLPSQAHAEWAASMQAYYAAAASSAGHPYAAWAAQQQVAPYPAVEAASAATKGKRKTRRATSGEGASSSGGDAGSQGSSEKGDAAADQKGSSSSTKRIKSGSATTEGEPSQAAMAQNPVTEPPSVGKGRSASKLSVSAPGRATLPNAAPTLNIGMDPWSTSPSVVTPSGQGEANAAASSQSNGSLSLMDERELKRERRKQSNRDSARRSRLRKQQECEELAQKVSDLTACNGTLRSELDQLKKDCEDMEAENKQLMDEMLRRDDKILQSEGRSVITTLSIQVEASQAHNGENGELHKNSNNNTKG